MQSPGCKAPPQHRANTLQSQRIFTNQSAINVTLQGINISHLGKRKIIFKMPFLGGYVSSLEGTIFFENPTTLKFEIQIFVSTKYFQFILRLVRDVYISGDVVTLIWMHIKSLPVYGKKCHSKWLHCSPTPYAYCVWNSLVDVIFTPRDLHPGCRWHWGWDLGCWKYCSHRFSELHAAFNANDATAHMAYRNVTRQVAFGYVFQELHAW